jgi:hypothetical protein
MVPLKIKKKILQSNLKYLFRGLLIFLLTVIFSCSSNEFSILLDNENPNNPSPIPGGGGIITDNVAGQSGKIVLSWVAATDDTAPLQYIICLSLTEDDVTTYSKAVASTSIISTGNDIVTFTTAALTAGTTYYFNVFVKDTNGNIAAYIHGSAIPE